MKTYEYKDSGTVNKNSESFILSRILKNLSLRENSKVILRYFINTCNLSFSGNSSHSGEHTLSLVSSLLPHEFYFIIK